MRLIGLLWIGLLIAGLLIGVLDMATRDLVADSKVSYFIFNTIPSLIYFALFIAMIVATFIIVVARFYNGLLGQEGYLMHTLPVKPWQLITAKGIVATIVIIIGMIVSIFSMLLINGLCDLGEVVRAIGNFFQALKLNSTWVLIAIEGIIIVIFGVIKSIYQIYASLSIGQLVNKHRILLSVGAYVGITTALVIIFVLLMTVADSTEFDYMFTQTLPKLGEVGMVQAFMGLVFLVEAVQVVAFHIVSERIMTKKLNLQ